MKDFFADKVAVVTGAGSGIGRALAADLVTRGAFVILVARGEERLKELSDELGKDNTAVCPADVTKFSELKRIAQWVKDEKGRIDILVNCAGIFKTGSLSELSTDVIEEVMAVNVNGTISSIKAFLPYMKEQGSGHIVVLSSLAGRVAFPGCAAYASSKFALYGFVNTVRPELQKSGIKILGVYPSFVDSPLVEGHMDSVKQSLFFRLTKGFSTEKVSRSILKGIEKNKREIVLPGSLSLTASLYSLFPRPIEAVVGLLHGGWPRL